MEVRGCANEREVGTVFQRLLEVRVGRHVGVRDGLGAALVTGVGRGDVVEAELPQAARTALSHRAAAADQHAHGVSLHLRLLYDGTAIGATLGPEQALCYDAVLGNRAYFRRVSEE